MKSSFTSSEKRVLLGLSGVLAARMMGFSLTIPMFRSYAEGTLGATQMQAGIAFGIYGLSQALLQIPFGTWSDRFGRKRMVSIGLFIFLVGSIVSAAAPDIYWLTFGYFLQGASAIASALLAWVADSIDVSRRNTGMALLGISIGASVVLGFPISAVVEKHWGGAAVFWLCAALSTVAWLVVQLALEEPRVHKFSETPDAGTSWLALLSDRELLTLNAAGFLVYFAMRAVFFVIPVALKALQVNISIMYLVVGFIGASLMGMGSRQSDKGRARAFISFSFLLMLAGDLMMGFLGGWSGTVIGYGVWFTGFCALQALLPGAVSKLASAESRGSTLGLFNTCQYIGTACGSFAAGALTPTSLYGLMAAMTAIVVVGVLAMRRVDQPMQTQLAFEG